MPTPEENIEDLKSRANLAFQKAGEAEKKKQQNYQELEACLEAAKHFGEAADLSQQLAGLDPTRKAYSSILSHYYRHECYKSEADCYYRQRESAQAQDFAKRSGDEIRLALKEAEEYKDDLSESQAEHIGSMLEDWKFRVVASQVQALSAKARSAWDEKRFIDALDIYNEMGDLYEKLVQDSANLSKAIQRVAKGNYMGVMTNVSNSTIGHLRGRDYHPDEEEVVMFKILEHAYRAFQYGNEAISANPEWDEYPTATASCRSNLVNLLTEIPDWASVLAHFQRDQGFQALMVAADPDKFNRAKGSTAGYQKGDFLSKNQDNDKRRAFYCGVAFLIVLLIVNIAIPIPTPSQREAFKTLMALAAAAFGIFIPGVLDVNVSSFVRAGGAAGFFVLVYFFAPAPEAKGPSTNIVPTTAPAVSPTPSKQAALPASEVRLIQGEISNRITKFESVLNDGTTLEYFQTGLASQWDKPDERGERTNYREQSLEALLTSLEKGASPEKLKMLNDLLSLSENVHQHHDFVAASGLTNVAEVKEWVRSHYVAPFQDESWRKLP